MQKFRFDRATLKAKRTDEGYLVDTPVVGRIGIQTYTKADGTIMRELRLPDEVFHADSLASFAGKPITDGHPSEIVTAANAKQLSIGMIKGDGIQDGDNVAAPIIILDGEAIEKAIYGGKSELSLGYTVDLDETPGEWNGQRYDAIQRNIRINHLAIVAKGRAGNARLNLDEAESRVDDLPGGTAMSDGNKLSRVRLDSGLEYDAAPEVAAAFAQVRADAADFKTKLDTVTAERDMLKAEVDKIPQIKADAAAAVKAELEIHSELVKKAVAFNVDCAGLDSTGIKIACIKAVRADADLTGKSADYIDAAFDMAVSVRNDAAIAAQRAAGVKTDGDDKNKPSAYATYKANLGRKED